MLCWFECQESKILICQNCGQYCSKNIEISQNCQNCKKLSVLSKVVKIINIVKGNMKNCPISSKLSKLSKYVKIVKKIVKMLVRSCLLITLIKCRKGHKCPEWPSDTRWLILCSKIKSESLSDKVTYWAVRLSSGQLKTKIMLWYGCIYTLQLNRKW